MRRSLAVLLDFQSLNHFIQVHNELLIFLSKKLSKIYFINISNYKKHINRASLIKKNSNFKNFVFLNPKNIKEFENIINENKFLILNIIDTSFKFFKFLRIIKKNNTPQIIISNIGFLTDSLRFSKNSLLNSSIYYFKKSFIHRFYILLTELNIMPKIDIRFISSKLQKKYFDRGKKNSINRLFCKKHFSHYKKLILVNSRSFDIFKNSKFKIKKENIIVFLDIKADHETNLYLDEKIIKANKEVFYKKLNFFLSWCSKKLKCKIIVCTHPYYNLSERKKIYKKFKVVQGKTKKYIQKCNSVIFFHSSAITEAFFLKKNILNLETKLLGKHWEHSSNLYPKYSGIPKINIDNPKYLEHLNIKEILKRKTKKYYNYRKNFLMPDGDKIGSEKIYKIINKKFNVN